MREPTHLSAVLEKQDDSIIVDHRQICYVLSLHFGHTEIPRTPTNLSHGKICLKNWAKNCSLQ
jgi:hypothetical protein